jgi:3-hydroxyisobutyrate dehydrogenase
MSRVAVLGTGKMGAGMARQLLAHGHDVTVWNRSRDRAEPLAADGATVADDPAEAVRGADVVLTVLFDADSVVEVLEQTGQALGPEAVVVQVATVGLDIDRVAEVAGRHGVRLLDAPVLGTRKPAEDGTLTVLASGDPALREVADPVLDAIGARTVWAGDEVGAASLLKLVCNAFTAAQTAATAQSVALAEGLGLDPRLFLEAISGGASDTPLARAKGAMMIEGDYPPAFDVTGLRKDLGLILAAAEQAGITTDLARTLHALAERAEERGHGGEDMAAIRTAF